MIRSGSTRHELDPVTEGPITRESDDSETRSVLTSLDRLDDGILALGRAFEVKTAEAGPARKPPAAPGAPSDRTHPVSTSREG
ncbi:MAG TPA: hypothetical protein VJT49_07440 [Amycolatopsis sp.]|uniref:hypothetical protein n=1 Tax=Amycolatopsis sp. TaxID=37632 RepID=UPI002B48FEE7|nr:hypothetical protein [Amycolatopsis sp.]HKS44940.1 hypothetical protein [Amycolatopsis sp.]